MADFMDDLKDLMNAAFREYSRKNGDKKLKKGEAFATLFNNGTLIITNRAKANIQILLDEPYMIDCFFGADAVDMILEEYEAEFGDRIIEEGDSIVGVFHDAVVVIGVENGKTEIQIVKGEPNRVDVTLDIAED